MKLDIKRRETRIAFSVMMLLATLSFCLSISDALSNSNELSALLPAYAYYMLHSSIIHQTGLVYLILAPLAAALPFSDGADENSRSLRCVVLTRCPRKRYIRARATSSFFVGFMIVAIPAALNLLWCQVAFPAFAPRNAINAISSMPAYDHFFRNIYLKGLYTSHPYLYAWMNALGVGFYGGICALMAYSLSLYVRKYPMLTVAAPFLVVNFASIAKQTTEVLVSGQTNMAAFYAHFQMAEDSQKLPLWAHAGIWLSLAGLSLLGIRCHANRRDDL